jgi:hypothetical protein
MIWVWLTTLQNEQRRLRIVKTCETLKIVAMELQLHGSLGLVLYQFAVAATVLWNKLTTETMAWV